MSPKWVPQMADADEVVARLRARGQAPRYSCIFLNAKGLERAVAHRKFDIRGGLWATASETFSKKNTNRTSRRPTSDLEERIGVFKRPASRSSDVGMMAAFGCNYEGDIDQNKVVDHAGAADRDRGATTARSHRHRARRHHGLGDAR